jgi:hypothetical protein
MSYELKKEMRKEKEGKEKGRRGVVEGKYLIK